MTDDRANVFPELRPQHDLTPVQTVRSRDLWAALAILCATVLRAFSSRLRP